MPKKRKNKLLIPQDESGFSTDHALLTEPQIPLSDRYMMTLYEASKYFSLSADWIYDMSENADIRYALLIDEEIYIKREVFAKFLDDHFSI